MNIVEAFKELIVESIQNGWDRYENVNIELTNRIGVPSLIVSNGEFIRIFNLNLVVYFAYKEDE